MEPILHLSLPVRDLGAAREFYVDQLGCRLGRERDEFIDVWFFGMQLTLQQRPDEVPADGAHGVRHFGVTLPRSQLDALVERLRARPVRWVEALTTDTTGLLDSKTSAKVADPSGNVIELKAYPDEAFASFTRAETPPR
ncbi:MAG TPA: VOC family protein [Acidimicrobiia bacterium]